MTVPSFSMKEIAKRESWKSRFGFMVAAVGSAVGLINIWRFPYIVKENGGAAFIAIYVFFLLLIGFPVLVSEVLIGRTGGRGPAGSLRDVSKSRGRALWGASGKGIIWTGFIVSSFYSVVAGWVLGYLVESIVHGFGGLTGVPAANAMFEAYRGSAVWCVGYTFLFMALSVGLLHRGVRRGIEAGNKVMMPLLVVLLLVLMLRGLTLPGGERGLHFLLTPNWSLITPISVLTALGHAFFTLSLGQGTMITYGSYLSGHEQIPSTCTPIVFFDTLVSIIAGIAILTVVYAAGDHMVGGPGLLFATLPTVFAAIPGGAVMAVMFFFLVVLAALTSQTSAMEPMINYLIDEKDWKRHKAVWVVGSGAFLLAIPSALSFSLLSRFTVGGQNFFEWISFAAMDLFIPLGGLVAVLYVGWAWGFKKAYPYLFGDEEKHSPFLRPYLAFTIKYVAPILIAAVFLTQLVSYFSN